MSLGNAYSDFGINVSQIYLYNNQISGKAFQNFLEGLNENQRKSLKGIVYSGQNELTQEALDVIQNQFLGKIIELRILGV